MGSARARVYIAGPYTTPDPATNVRRAVEAAESLEAAGFHAVVPHLSLLWHSVVPHDYRFWMTRGLRELASCHAVLRLAGDSPGADEEVRHTWNIGLSVCSTVDALRARFPLDREVRR